MISYLDDEGSEWQNVDVPFSDDVSCLIVTKQGNLLIETIKGEIWLSRPPKLSRWHKIEGASNQMNTSGKIFYSVGDKPKLWPLGNK